MKDLNEKTFKEAVKTGTTIIDFWAPWCGPCKLMAPVFEEISKQIQEINFAKVNVDEAQDLAIQLSVNSIPTLVIFKNGEEIDRRSGYMPRIEFKKWVENYVS
ncbi:thioredoxin [Candidatus Woesearchaeota archaeon]|nr:thioredoxin [Candidatus Woesearchaeota archaeon]